MDMEQEFDVEIPDELLPKIKTVGDIMQFLAENKNQPSTHGPASAGAGFFQMKQERLRLQGRRKYDL